MGESEGREKRNPSESATSPKKVARQLDLDFKGIVTNRTPLLSQPFLSLTPRVKLESPNLGPRLNVEAKVSTPKKQRKCNCKHSRCLKLYCECFSLGIYCDGCNCVNCHNNIWHGTERQHAIDVILERDPNAFASKIDSSPCGNRDNKKEVGILGKHKKGCNCKKSGCLKKYCECFQANVLCSDNCKCMDCKNFEGSDERQALFHGDHNNMSYIQQAANAAINGAVGSSGFGSAPFSKKSKVQETCFMPAARDPYRIGNFQQFNTVKTLMSSSPLSSTPFSDNGITLGYSKFTFRSLLADIIQPQDVKELCSVLVKFSQEATKAYADQKREPEKQTEDHIKASLPTSIVNRLQNQEEAVGEKTEAADCKSRILADYSGHDDAGSDAADFGKGSPISPGTLALMCDEDDTMFRTTACPNGIMDPGGNFCSKLLNMDGATDVYAEQERLVLTKFRDCLGWLITKGEIREKDCSLAMRSDSGIYGHSINNGTPNGRTNASDLPEQVCNIIVKTIAQPTAGVSHSILTSSPASNHVQQLKLSSLNSNGDLKPKMDKGL